MADSVGKQEIFSEGMTQASQPSYFGSDIQASGDSVSQPRSGLNGFRKVFTESSESSMQDGQVPSGYGSTEDISLDSSDSSSDSIQDPSISGGLNGSGAPGMDISSRELELERREIELERRELALERKELEQEKSGKSESWQSDGTKDTSGLSGQTGISTGTNPRDYQVVGIQQPALQNQTDRSSTVDSDLGIDSSASSDTNMGLSYN